MMLEAIEKKMSDWLNDISQVSSVLELEKLKYDLLGKTGVVTGAFKSIGRLDEAGKKAYGAKINDIKNSLVQAIKQKKIAIERFCVEQKLQSEAIDVTLPVAKRRFGGLHVLTTTARKISEYYNSRGFHVFDGPEVETEFFNFDALNISKHHPARQSHDTFYLEDFLDILLRTQTSPVQIRSMTQMGLPIRMISIGKTYRNDCLDSTHSPMFHQMECLVADRNPVCVGNLKSELKKFLTFFFEVPEVALRFRPSFFPFTEPGLEVDCRYMKKDGQLIMSPDGDKWLEIGGAGMVHPNVFKNCNIEGEAFGFAFGMGLERLVMLKHGIQDIRNIFETDERWLAHCS